MKVFNKKKIVICLTFLAFTMSIMSSSVFAVRNTCKTGMFLGYDNTVSINGISTYNPDIVSYDYCNWNGSGANAISYKHNQTVKNVNKVISISCHMPNPKGGNAKTPMSASDFSTLSNTKIQSITSSSSPMLQTYKAEVDKIADGLGKFGTTVYFRPFHEMNGNWFWWGNQKTSDFKNLWNNLYDYVVNCRGLNKVKFVYSPNKGNYAADYYPGNSTVTWIGIDAYSDNPVNDNDIKNAYNALVGKGKPIGFSEIGPAVGGAYVDSNNNQIKKFNYSLWNDAINKTYTNISFFITWDGAYAPFNNNNGSTLFKKQFSW